MKKLLLVIFIICSSTLYSQGWIQQSSGTSNLLWSVSFVDLLTGWAVGGLNGSATIVKTTNGGVNWIAQTSPVTNGLNAVKFINSNTGWISTEGGLILKTTNGGSLYFQQTSGFSGNLYCMYFQDENTGYMAGQTGKIIKTTNGGINWNNSPSGSSDLFSGIYFSSSQIGYATGGNYPVSGSVYKTMNAGTSWFVQTIPSIPVCEEVYFVDDNTGWLTSNSGNILKTTNGGTNWYSQNIATTYNIMDVIFINPLTGWVSGGAIAGTASNGAIWKTTNGGTNWYIQLLGTFITAMNFPSVDIGYGVAYNGTIFKTTTSGETVPPAPTLLSPANNSTNVGLTPTLFWNTSAGATSYKVLVSSMVTFGNVIDSATVTTNQRTIPSGKLNVASTYYWKVLANNQYGSSPWSDAWNFSTVITGITKINSEIPSSFSVSQNYPNPFNPTTSIKIDIPTSTFTKLAVYDIMGREIKVVVNEKLSPGTYQISFDGDELNSGVYFYRLITDNFTETKRMLLIK